MVEPAKEEAVKVVVLVGAAVDTSARRAKTAAWEVRESFMLLGEA